MCVTGLKTIEDGIPSTQKGHFTCPSWALQADGISLFTVIPPPQIHIDGYNENSLSFTLTTAGTIKVLGGGLVLSYSIAGRSQSLRGPTEFNLQHPLSPARSTEPGVSFEHCHVWSPNQTQSNIDIDIGVGVGGG